MSAVRPESAPTGIDVHGHAVPVPFLQAIQRSRNYGVEVVADKASGGYVVTFPGHAPVRPMSQRMLDIDGRMAWLDGQAMQRQVVAPWLDVQGQELDAATGGHWVRQLNDAMAETVSATAGRLTAHATLHLADARGAAAELERCHRELGMRGCMVPTHFASGHLSEPRYDALWEVAEGLRMPVVLHPTTLGPGSRAEGMEEFRSLYGRLIDTTTTATLLLLSGILDRFPKLQVVLVHGGGFLPYQSGRLDAEQAVRPDGWGVEGVLSDHVRRYYFDTVLMSTRAIKLLLDLVGKRQVMIGSDYPFTVGGPPLTRALCEATTDESTRAAVDHENALRLYGGGLSRVEA